MHDHVSKQDQLYFQRIYTTFGYHYKYQIQRLLNKFVGWWWIAGAGAWAFATSTSMDPGPRSTGLTGFGGQVCDGGLRGDYGEDCCCNCWFCSCVLLRHLSTVLRCCLRSCALSCRWPFPFPSPHHRTVLRFRSVDHGIADCRTHDSLLY